jgi:hypothetical protein
MLKPIGHMNGYGAAAAGTLAIAGIGGIACIPGIPGIPGIPCMAGIIPGAKPGIIA